MLAFVALLAGLFTGYFQATSTKLENQRHDLETQVKDFDTKRDAFRRENEEAKKALEGAKRIGESRQDYAQRQAYLAHKCEEELKALRSQRRN
jgi:hypothetical protein